VASCARLKAFRVCAQFQWHDGRLPDSDLDNDRLSRSRERILFILENPAEGAVYRYSLPVADICFCFPSVWTGLGREEVESHKGTAAYNYITSGQEVSLILPTKVVLSLFLEFDDELREH